VPGLALHRADESSGGELDGAHNQLLVRAYLTLAKVTLADF
jgi:hypothetical protein